MFQKNLKTNLIAFFVAFLIFEALVGIIVGGYVFYVDNQEKSGSEKSYERNIGFRPTEIATRQDIFLMLTKTGLILVPQNWPLVLMSPTFEEYRIFKTFPEETQEANQVISYANNELRQFGINTQHYTFCEQENVRCMGGYRQFIEFDISPGNEKLTNKIQQTIEKYNLEIYSKIVYSEYYKIYTLPGTVFFYSEQLKQEKIAEEVGVDSTFAKGMFDPPFPFSPLF